MNNIIVEAVRETGCIMYKDEQGNYVDSFFIGQYWFDQLTSKQVQTLTELLQKDTIEPFQIFYKHEKLYLPFNNHNNVHCIYEIYNNGMAKVFILEEFVNELEWIDFSNFNLLYDFSEAKKGVNYQ